VHDLGLGVVWMGRWRTACADRRVVGVCRVASESTDRGDCDLSVLFGRLECWSGWPDLNRRPLDPQAMIMGFGVAPHTVLAASIGRCRSPSSITVRADCHPVRLPHPHSPRPLPGVRCMYLVPKLATTVSGVFVDESQSAGLAVKDGGTVDLCRQPRRGAGNASATPLTGCAASLARSSSAALAVAGEPRSFLIRCRPTAPDISGCVVGSPVPGAHMRTHGRHPEARSPLTRASFPSSRVRPIRTSGCHSGSRSNAGAERCGHTTQST
jgi:hypothetical protein